ncbi:chromosome partitioning protein ParA [Neorhizobium sp. SOG26]|jgi:ATPases involved in chromosome partitioning|uniref:ParA family protein n=1 Tax=Neorhizobium turbinariae TaxID=2937795 RepID=A0ABT0IVL9_9HYPH|nr:MULTISPECIES: ParA family protein [Neorhizobium]AXV17451.1 chromosome partitioning protein ParA [Neorhizobium sp. SOG26]MCK8781933.1 ParA family protein [Neorhizobium turbinariae]
MPVITFANTKGGAGKTTAVLLLATELVEQGYRVTILDADPQYWISRWHMLSPPNPNLHVISYVTASSIDRHISENRHRTDYFVLDLPGAQSPLLAKAIGMSDHVLIPIQGCAMDAQGGANVLELLRYLEDKANLRVPHSVVLTRVNSMVTTRALLAVKMLLAERNVDVLNTPIIERAAFRDIFDIGGTLYTMDEARVSNLDKARQNARLFALEMLKRVPLYHRKPLSERFVKAA